MTSITNENSPNTYPIKSEEIDKKIKEEEIIDTTIDLDENILTKDRLTLINSDKVEILSQLQSLLENINLVQENINNITSFICDKIFKFRNLILEDIFSLIFSSNHVIPKIEFLCLITEILSKNFGLEKTDLFSEKISIIFKKIIFPYIKGVCLDLYSTLIDRNQSNVIYFMDIWEKNNLLGSDFIKEIKFELKFWNEPNITGSEKDAKYLMNLVNFGEFKIEQNLIDFSRSVEALERNKDNFHRKNMLKIEKELIQKQVRLYHTHLIQLKDIDTLLDKIKEHPELFEKEKNEIIQ